MMRLFYLLSSALRFFTPKKCPHCGSNKTQVIDRKYLVTRLLLCKKCSLQFRHPGDGKSSFLFYNTFYRQKGITTDLPDDTTLAIYKQTNFAGTGRSIETVKKIIENLLGSLSEKSLLDYGCSWGYMTWQFAQAGMHVQGFEIGKSRADFGTKKLGIPITTKMEDIETGFDVIFSSHVIEHLNNISGFTELALAKLKPGGYLITLCPNGSSDYKKKSPQGFHLFWGQVHPNLISQEFYGHIFQKFPCYISSSPYNFSDIKTWNQTSHHNLMNGGDELLCIVKKS